MNNKELAKAFADGAVKGKGSNMFIEGDTIYSCGYHFKIAVRYGDYYLFNSKGYSHSTAKQQSHVRSELPEFKIIECPDCNLVVAETYLKSELEALRLKQSRARTSNYNREINNTCRMIDIVTSFILPY